MRTSTERCLAGEGSVVVMGAGYVGLQLAMLMTDNVHVQALDVNVQRVAELTTGVDSTGMFTRDQLTRVNFTVDANVLMEADVVFIAVPTPVKEGSPDYLAINLATRMLIDHLNTPDATVILVSTVGPGRTRVLTDELRRSLPDVRVAFCPERMSVGDLSVAHEVHLIGADDAGTLVDVVTFYKLALGLRTFATSVGVAELAKLLENAKRDVNVALVNTVAALADRTGVSATEVLRAAATKSNFTSATYRPGFVGGHCIAVDPYLLSTAVEEYVPELAPTVLRSARAVNDAVVDVVVADLAVVGARRVMILGAAFKPNCRDVRNSLVGTLRDRLTRVNASAVIYDPIVDLNTFRREFPATALLVDPPTDPMDAVVVYAAHDVFFDLAWVDAVTDGGVVIDPAGAFAGVSWPRGIVYRGW